METNPKPSLVGKPLPHKDLAGKPYKEDLNYRTAVGMLTYLQANSRQEMLMTLTKLHASAISLCYNTRRTSMVRFKSLI